MLKNNRQLITVNFAGYELELHASGVCYWPLKKTLIVSDLHLEKGSFFALRGHPLPITDTRLTIEKLQQELLYLKPETVICLGDNIHDGKGFERMMHQDMSLLESLCKSVSSWLWIIGNHDHVIHEHLFKKIPFAADIIIDALLFSHEPQKNTLHQIVGHYHPKISFKNHGTKVSGKCFIVTEKQIILPAFGSYTGGLDITNAVYDDILEGKRHYYLIRDHNIFWVK